MCWSDYSIEIQHSAGSNDWVRTSYVQGGNVRLMDNWALFDTVIEETEIQLTNIYLQVVPPQSSPRLQVVSVQQQDVLHDCGLYAIAHITEVKVGGNPEVGQFNQKRI